MSQNEIRQTNLLNYIKANFTSINEFIDKIGETKNKGALYEILKGKRPFGERKARQLENKLNLPTGTLDKTDKTEPEVEIFYIPEYSLQLSAGTGCDFLDEYIVKRYPVDKELLLKFGWKAENLIIVSVLGDSMSPNIQDGEKVVINTIDTELKDGKVFAFCKNNEMFIKRVFRKPGTNNFDLSSDNPIYGKVSLCEFDNISTLGRAVYILGKEI